MSDILPDATFDEDAMIKQAIIEPAEGGGFNLWTKDRKRVLGHHATKREAAIQEWIIQRSVQEKAEGSSEKEAQTSDKMDKAGEAADLTPEGAQADAGAGVLADISLSTKEAAYLPDDFSTEMFPGELSADDDLPLLLTKMGAAVNPAPPPLTGPEALHYALSKLDLGKLEAEAKAVITSKKVSKRPLAIQQLNILEGMKRNDFKPQDLMIHAVPILPPVFRPYSMMGSTFVPGDANELAKDFFDMRDAHKESAGVFGPEGAGEERLKMYDAVKALYGYGDPVKPKTLQRGVSGFLQQVAGSSPKTGWVQRRLLSKTQDSVGRGVATIGADLGMDEVGIPEDMAWTAYSPYIHRNLTRSGMSGMDVISHIKSRSPYARKALENEMEVRPVIVSRAPVWHKFGVVAQRPKIAPGSSVMVNPFITAGMGCDFDGNCIVIGTNLWLRLPATSVYAESLMRLPANTRLLYRSPDHFVFETTIELFPHLLTGRLDKNGSMVHDVPPGVEVLTNYPDGKGVRWSAAESFTVDGVKAVSKITTSMGKEFTVSDNESVAIYQAGGTIARVTPASLKPTDLIPVLRGLPDCSMSIAFTAHYGWMIGAFVSDGWVSGQMIGYTKAEPAKRARFIEAVTSYCGSEVLAKNYSSMHDALTNAGISGESTKIYLNITKESPPLLKQLLGYLKTCYHGDKDLAENDAKRACLFKQLPMLWLQLPREVRIDILAGILDGDGSVAISNAKGKPQVMVNLSTSSPWLRDSVQQLLTSLGVRSSYSTLLPKEGRLQKHPNYVISISTPDLLPIVVELNSRMISGGAGLQQLMQSGVAHDYRNIVPVDMALVNEVLRNKELALGVNRSSLMTLRCKNKPCNFVRVSRDMAESILGHWKGDRSAAHWQALIHVLGDATLGWEMVASVEAAGECEVFDIGVPETKVFALANGVIVYDTLNVHVPSQDDAVKEAYEKLLPSKMLFSIKDQDSTSALPKHEGLLGMWAANRRPSTQTHRFASKADALKAINRGDVSLKDEVEFPDEKVVAPAAGPAKSAA